MLVRTVVEAVGASGVGREAFLRSAGFDPSRLDDGDGRISLEEYDALQQRALQVTGDPALGLHMGEQSSLVQFDVVGHLLAHARTMREGVDLFVRFHRILSDCPDSRLREEGTLATFEYEYPRGEALCNRLRAEFGVTVLLAMGRHYVGRDKLARRVHFEHAAPTYVDEYRRLFGADVVFDQPFTGVTFDRALLDRRQIHVDAELSSVLEHQAERKIGRLERAVGYRERLREYLVANAVRQKLDMETVARRFGMSVRSLRRRLTEEGVTYGALAEEALATVAKRMLEDPRRSIQETAYAIGFSDPSAFHRAFKRWTGMTPRKYRESRESH